MVEVNVESRTMGPTFYRLTSLSFQVSQPSHSWYTAFSDFDLENLRSRSWVRQTLKVTTWVQHYIDSHPFRSMSICHPIPEIRLFQNLTLKIQGRGQMTMVLHNYRSRQFHRTLNGINPSSSFRDMGSTSLAQVLPDLTSFLAHWQAHMGQMGKNYDSAQLKVGTSP